MIMGTALKLATSLAFLCVSEISAHKVTFGLGEEIKSSAEGDYDGLQHKNNSSTLLPFVHEKEDLPDKDNYSSKLFLAPVGSIPVEQEYIVIINDDITDVEGEMKALLGAINDGIDNFDAKGLGGVWNINDSFKGQNVKMTHDQAQAMSLMNSVKYIEQNIIIENDMELPSVDELVVDNDVVSTQDNPAWGLDRIDQRYLPLDAKYAYDYDGTGVTVYVMDSGVRKTHREFTGRLIQSRFSKICKVSEHGTHVAGIIGGTKYGVAKGVTLVDVDWCNGEQESTVTLIKIYDWIKSDAKNKKAIVNASFVGKYHSKRGSQERAISALVDSGVVVVAAAGNKGSDACGHFPAGHPDVITVGYTNRQDEMNKNSNYGSCVDIFAPGTSILSAGVQSDTARVVLSGTSMAAPHVTGAAALILQQFPDMTPLQVKNELLRRSTKGVITKLKQGSPNRLLYTLPVKSCRFPPGKTRPRGCGKGELCELEWNTEFKCANKGDGRKFGVCISTTVDCDTTGDPVCGCDGKQYDNRCMATQAQRNVLSVGQCRNLRTGEGFQRMIGKYD